MTTYQAQIRLGNLPVNLVLVGNREEGKVVFVRTSAFPLLVLDVGGEVEGRFYKDSFDLYAHDEQAETFEYNRLYDYKNTPLMLRWLQQQNLQRPDGVYG